MICRSSKSQLFRANNHGRILRGYNQRGTNLWVKRRSIDRSEIMGSSMSSNVSAAAVSRKKSSGGEEAYKRSADESRDIFRENHRRSPSPRSVQNHPVVLVYPNSSQPQQQQPSQPLVATDELLRLIRSSDWDAVRFRLQTHRRDAAYVDNNDRTNSPGTPLRVACLHRAPHDILVPLMAAWPVALWTQDSDGWIPLHVNLLYTSPHSSAGTTTTDQSFTPEETTVALIRAGGEAAASIHSRFGGSALHLACRHGTSVRILQELLLASPEQVRIPNHAQCYPTNLLYKQYYQQERNLRQRQQLDDDNDESQFELELLQRLNLLVAASKGRPILNDDDRLVLLGDPYHPLYTLHDVIAFHFDYASQANFVTLYLSIYPDAATVIDTTSGRTPLHVAASYNYQFNLTVTDPLITVLPANPAAACRCDHQGRLPLHIALHSRRSFTSATFKQLVAAYPLAVECRCPDTGLLPFQLAALPCRDTYPLLPDNHVHPYFDMKPLDISYELLRACPQLLQGSASLLDC
jgi:hypothetical protein